MKMDELKELINQSPYKDKLLYSTVGTAFMPFLMCAFLDKEEIEKIMEEYKNER